MNIDELISNCSSKEGAEECFPFNPDTLVFKVNGKMFLLTGLEHEPLQFTVKCAPDRAVELKEAYECITAAYHMNKTHWISLTVDQTISNKLLKEIIDASYKLVRNTRKKTKKR